MRSLIPVASLMIAWILVAQQPASVQFEPAQPQTAPEQPVEILVEVNKPTQYQLDTFDAGKLAKDPGPTTAVPRTFQQRISIGDIVAVNGKPARGLWTTQILEVFHRVNPSAGQAIADVNADGRLHCTWHFLDENGAWIGTLTDTGATPEPSHSVVSGNGAFFGVIGEHRLLESLGAARQASVTEDPANRRIHGRGGWRGIFRLYPRFRPEVQMTQAGPAIFHGDDFSLVTAANPVRRGELLIIRATGLGPVKPDLQPVGAKPFSADPLQVVNSPVSVIFNAAELAVLNKVGWPGEINVYRVDFQVPPDAPQGAASITLVAAWIPGAAVTVPVR